MPNRKNNTHRYATLLIALLALTGCGLKKYRVLKAFNGRVQVLDESFTQGPRLVDVQFKDSEDADFVPYQMEQAPSGNPRPPQIHSKSVIDLAVNPAIDEKRLSLQIFIKKDPTFDGDLVEVKTIVAEIPGELPNAITFIDDLFPRQHRRLLLYPDDLIGPYQGLHLQAHDWLVLSIEDQASGESQKLVFEYIPVGLRVSTGAHLLFSTGVNLLDLGVAQIQETNQSSAPRRRSELATEAGQIDPGGLDLALTFTAAVGYRGTTRNGPKRWLSDNLTLVLDIGVGNVGEIESILSEGTAFEERVVVLQNQLLLGAGVQLFDFVSLHLLNNVAANFPVRDGVDVEAVLIPELGLDVATAVRFSKRLYERLFTSTARRTMPVPPLPSPTRLMPPLCKEKKAPCPQEDIEGPLLDESYQAPE